MESKKKDVKFIKFLLAFVSPPYGGGDISNFF